MSYEYLCLECANRRCTLGTPALEGICSKCGNLKKVAHVIQYNLTPDLKPILQKEFD